MLLFLPFRKSWACPELREKHEKRFKWIWFNRNFGSFIHLTWFFGLFSLHWAKQITGTTRSLRGGKKKQLYQGLKTHQHIHFSCLAWNQTKNLPPVIPGPFLLMAWLLNSHRFARCHPLGFAEEESSWRGPCFDRSATAVWNAWMDSMCLFRNLWYASC